LYMVDDESMEFRDSMLSLLDEVEDEQQEELT